jgi:hypothetical protein
VCPVVPLTLLDAKVPFEFIDLDATTLCIHWKSLIGRVSVAKAPPVSAVIYIRTYGYEGEDLAPLARELKDSRSAPLLIDDRCLCRPEPDLEKVDMQGADVVLFSTGHAKYVDLGWGGFAHIEEKVPYVAADNGFAQAQLNRLTSFYKRHVRSGHPIFEKGKEEQAIALIGRYRGWLDRTPRKTEWGAYLEEIAEARRLCDTQKARLNEVYRRYLPPQIQMAGGYHAWRYQVRVRQKEVLLRNVFAESLFASDHFFPASVLFGGEPLAVAAELHNNVVNLFNDKYFSDEQARRIAELTRQHCDEYGVCV